MLIDLPLGRRLHYFEKDNPSLQSDSLGRRVFFLSLLSAAYVASRVSTLSTRSLSPFGKSVMPRFYFG